VIITHHAAERARKRCGLSRRSLERMAAKVLEHGLRQEQTSGRMWRFLNGKAIKYQSGNQNRVHGEHVWVIDNGKLVTVVPLPRDLRKLARQCPMTGKRAPEKF
jgi:hypothetical protein